jgi:hypothetical protein
MSQGEQPVMQYTRRNLALVFLLCTVSFAQVKQENRSLVVNGRSGDAAVVQINGRNYVDLETLARIAQGSLGFRGNEITLTLPTSAASPSVATSEPEHTNPSGLSRNFVVSGIETIAKMREWGSTLAYAIQHGYGVTESWVAGYREQAASSLSLATDAASTDEDRNALQLLTNEFASVRQWSNNLVAAKQSMNTAQYAMSPDALRNDPLSQKIITCGRFLGAMLGGGEFKDDASCH